MASSAATLEPEAWPSFARGVAAHTRIQLRVLALRLVRVNPLSLVVIMVLVPALIPGLLAALDAADVLGTANFVTEARSYPPVDASAAAADALAAWRAAPARVAFAPEDDAAAMAAAARACALLGVDFAGVRKLPASDAPATALFDLGTQSDPPRIAVLFGAAQLWGAAGPSGSGLNFSVFLRQDSTDARALRGTALGVMLGDNAPSEEEPLLASGGTLMQAAVNRAVLDALAGAPLAPGAPLADAWALQRLPDAAREFVNPTRRILYALLFLTALSQGSVVVLAGTQEKLRERRALMLHGLRPQAFVLAHFVLGVARGVVAATTALTVAFAAGVFTASGAGFVVGGFFLFVCAQAGFNAFVIAGTGRWLSAQIATGLTMVQSLLFTGAVLATQIVLADPEAFGLDRAPVAPAELLPLFLLPHLALGNVLWSAGAARQASAPFEDTFAPAALGMLFLDTALWLLLALLVDSLRFSGACRRRSAAAAPSPAEAAQFAICAVDLARHFSVPAPDASEALLRDGGAGGGGGAGVGGGDDDDLAEREQLVERKLRWFEKQALLFGCPPPHARVPASLLDEHGYLLSKAARRREYEARHGKQQQRRCGRVLLRAVDGLTLRVRRREILCLLGQNGSGKTTAMDMITGALQPSAGAVWVSGLPVSQRPGLTRGNLGLCAQHDVVFNSLSCLELLQVCGELHGIGAAASRAEGAALLQRLGIGAKQHARPMTLSGGQRRRLSVAAAVMGRPPVIVLDEPTTGLSVEHRRTVWGLLTELKEEHTVVLSTHSMEEAEAIADRVAIMADGKLQAEGTLRELRKLYGGWAHLACVRAREAAIPAPDKSNAGSGEEGSGEGASAGASGGGAAALRAARLRQAEAILAAVREVVPQAQLLRSVGPKVSLSLPLDAQPLYADLFELLEARRDALQLRSFAVSPSTLDDVFLRLAADLAASKRAEIHAHAHAHAQQADSTVAAPLPQRDMTRGALAGRDAESAEVQVRVAPRPLPPATAPGENGSHDGAAAGEALALRPRALRQARALAGQVLRTTARRPASMVQALAVPVLYGAIGGAIILSLKTFALAPAPSGPLSVGSSLARFASALPVPFSADDEAGARTLLGAELAGVSVPEAQVVDATAALFAMGGLQLRSSTAAVPLPAPVPALEVGVVYNQAGAAAGNALLQAVASRAALSAGLAPEIRCTFGTWRAPLTAGSQAATNGMHMAGIAFAIVASIAAVDIARLRAAHVKDMLLNTGLSQGVYWVTNGAMHALLAFLSMTLVMLVLLAFGADGLREGAGLPLMLLLLLLVAPANTACAYCLSLPFKTVEGAEQLMAWVLLTPFFLAWALSAFAFGDEPVPAFDNAFTALVPSFALYRGLVVLQASALNGGPLSFGDGFVWGSTFAQVLTFSALSLLLYCGLFFVVGFEHPHQRKRASRFCGLGAHGGGCGVVHDADDKALLHGEDESTDADADSRAQENVRCVMSGTLPPPLPAFPPRGSYGDASELPLRAYHLSKWFGDVQALRDVTLGTTHGTITGLLGPNGSAKSTLMNCITRFEGFGPDAGDALVAGYSVRRNMPAVRRLIGLCPQFDALVEVLSPRELLRDMCNIRGVAPARVDALVERFLHDLGLTPKADAACGTLSGGNKRRVSIAQAMIASPALVLLDEPTTGIDLVCRRAIWDFLLDATDSRQHSCVLATHSMEEADALCQRLVIMVAGSIRAAGTSDELKSRYGDGIVVRLEMASSRGAREAADAAVHALRPDGGAQLLKVQRGTDFQYLVPSDGLSWAHVFKTLQRDPAIEDFTVAQRSLEDVFLQLASLQ